MKVFQIIAYLTLGANVAYALTAESAEGTTNAANIQLPGLDPVQSRHANSIIVEAKKDGVGAHGCQAGIAIALSETGLKILANPNVPESMNLQHDDQALHGDSIGIFQQSASRYPIECAMRVPCSSNTLFNEIKRINGWRKMSIPTIYQKINKSGKSSAIAKYLDPAINVCKAGGL
ncbi:hypothetical protein BDV39DRAFT_198843 [Aspergillus sergii]|uniref:Uncharacterized protein n=1 Tax=Aspergillus sergii TaxID=1034303 RepID=A0A5N6XKY3_9EURO|nr:hypothetical protein BDV39DRAFT_198843 [Aspergillus sergii]